MSAVLRVVIDDNTAKRLHAIAAERFNQHKIGDAERERQIEELAENAISEAALDFYRDRGFRDDPAGAAP